MRETDKKVLQPLVDMKTYLKSKINPQETKENHTITYLNHIKIGNETLINKEHFFKTGQEFKSMNMNSLAQYNFIMSNNMYGVNVAQQQAIIRDCLRRCFYSISQLLDYVFDSKVTYMQYDDISKMYNDIYMCCITAFTQFIDPIAIEHSLQVYLSKINSIEILDINRVLSLLIQPPIISYTNYCMCIIERYMLDNIFEASVDKITVDQYNDISVEIGKYHDQMIQIFYHYLNNTVETLVFETSDMSVPDEELGLQERETN